MGRILLSVLCSVGFAGQLDAQCTVNATFDLTGQPAGSATSSSILRDQKCCGSNSDDCVSFNVILDPGSVGLVFEIIGGAVPSGSLFYQVNCGPETSVGQSICLQGGQSYNLTFCKPGANENVYKITSIADLSVADVSIKAGCSAQLTAQIPNNGGSISWSGVDPATNAWLSCTNCTSPTITLPLNTSLTSVTYNVTWTGTNFACSTPISSTKQVTVTIVPPPTLSISPAAPRYCANAISPISANVSGAGTYTVRWFSGSNGTGSQVETGPTFTPPTTVGTASYSVRVEDTGNPCNFTLANFSVQIDPAPSFDIPDINMCIGDERRVTLSTQNTYSWSSTSGIVAYPNATYGISSAASGTYSVTATNGSACTATDMFSVSTQTCTNCPLTTSSCTVQSAPPFTKIEDYISASGAVVFPCTVPSSGITMLSEAISAGTCPITITRRYRIVDNCGNQDTCIHTVRVEDTIPPVFTTATPVFAPIACNQTLPAQPNLNATDNCSASVVKSIDPFTVNQCSGYSVTYRWRATDLCGNWVETTSVIQVLPDGQAPVFVSFPADITVNCDSVPALQTPTFSDNCDVSPSLTMATVETPGACPSAKTIRHTWTLRDQCGNTTVRTQTITVIDNVAPVFFGVPSNRTEACSNISTPVTPTVTDNCTPTASIGIVFGEVKSNITCTNTYTLTRTWTATDLCGNTRSVSQVIQVRDIVAPVLVATPANTTVSCENIPVVPTVTATDNCDSNPVVVYAQTRVNGNCAYRYTLNRTWTATDACGNSSAYTQIITVQDNTAPTFSSFPADVSVSCSGIPPVDSPAFADNCDPSPTISFAELNVPGACPFSYSLKRTWTIQDVCGNSFSRTQTITVSDTTKPDFNQYPADILVSCSSIPAAVTLTASDNCSPPPTVNFNQVIGASCAAIYTITRTWTASDQCGNQRTHVQVVTVQDDQAPQFVNPPADVTVACTAVPSVPTVSASDNCTPNPAIQFTETRTNGSCSYNYVLTRKWIATDLCGNAREHIQTITVKDDIGPTLAGVPADATADCQSIPLPANPSATDNCDNSPKIKLDISTINGICPGTYTLVRKWTARDTCGNETFKIQNIAVSDSQAPQITASFSDQTVACNALPGLPTVSVADVCDPNPLLSFRVDSLPGSCPGNYVLNRVWTAKDWCNNTSSVVQKITVQDMSAPTFLNFPSDQTLSCESIPSPASIQVSDACDPNPVLTFSQSGGGFCNGSSLTRTWTATDWCGNAFSKTQLIQIQDNTPPAISGVPSNAIVDCANIPTKANPVASDNCDPNPVLQFSETKGGSCSSTYTITRTWTARDSCGNTSTKVQVITVQDSQAPQWQNAPADIDVSCTQVPTAPNLSASDNCDGNPVTSYKETRIDGACLYSYTLEREWTATDSCGNVGKHKQIIRVKDATAPVLSGVPGNVTVPCDGIPTPASPTATDNCDPNPTIQFAETKISGTCAYAYTLRRTWTVSDLCGNRDSAVQVIQVIDNQAPVFTSFPADTSVSCHQIPAAVAPVATDACDPMPTLTKSENILQGSCPGTYTLERTWVALDQCGNSTFKTQRIQVRDVIAPVLQNVPANTTVPCGMVPAPAAVSATDNCDADPDVTYSETKSTGCAGSYTITRTWRAVDACGNSTSASQVITVVDGVLPVFSTTPANVSVSCNQIPAVPVVTATDNCTQALSVVFSETSTAGSCPGNYTLSRKWTAVDSCGNIATHVQLIQVSDLSAPVFSNVPADVQANCGAVPSVVTPSITDNCDNNPTLVLTVTILPGTCPQNYTIERLWTARDACGNQSTAKQLVKISDPLAPVLSALPTDKTVSCDQIPTAATLTLSDNCDPSPLLTYRQDTIPGTCPSRFSLVRTWTGRDACGNTASGTQTITVQDQTAPVMVGIPANATVSCAAVPTAPVITVSDNCDPNPFLAFTELSAAGTCPGNRTITRTWSAGDACGNSVSATQVLTIRDTEAPAFSNPPASVSVSCKDIPNTTSLIATDNCDPDPQVTFAETTSPDCSGSYTITRTWVAKDDCGNTKQHQQIITVTDNEKPQLFGIPQDQTLLCGQQPIAAQPVVLDNCDPSPKLVFTQDSLPGTCAFNYTLVKKWRATDRCGNTTEKTQTLSFSDNQAPVWSNVPSDLSLLCSDPVPNAQPTASDNCGSAFTVVFKDSLSAPICPQNYTLTRRWTATDACGNSSVVVQKIEVKDQIAPVMQGLPMDLSASCSNVPVAPVVTATDNCDQAAKVSYSEVKTPGACVNTYTLKRTWTARDACNNESKFTQTVQIEDKIPPVLESPPADIVVRCKEAVPAMPNLKWTDNCSGSGSVAGIDISDGKNPETITRTWRIADACGFSTSVSQKIQIVPMQGTASNDGPVCEGSAVNLSASGGTTYQWSGPSNFSSTSATPLINPITAQKAGTYTVLVKDPQGCALSLKTEVLVKIPPVTPFSVRICRGTSFTLNGKTFTSAGTSPVVFKNAAANGCDSTVLLQVEVIDAARQTIEVYICPGSSFLLNGKSFSTEGTFEERLIGASQGGCDSIVTLNLKVRNQVVYAIKAKICTGEEYRLNNQPYIASGKYTQLLAGAAAGGCDSLIELDLTVNVPSIRFLSTSICKGESFSVGAETFSESGKYPVTLKKASVHGCDSIVNLTLTVLDPGVHQLSQTICAGDFYALNGSNFNASGNYEQVLQGRSSGGCDSVIQLSLTVLPEALGTLSPSVCEGETFTANGTSYANQGAFTQVLQGRAKSGCDSILQIALTVNPLQQSVIEKTICFAESFSLNGITYRETGIYTQTFKDALNCDSTVTLNLTRLAPSESNVSANICQGESYSIGDQTLDKAGVYSVLLPGASAYGCDSIVNLKLTTGVPSSFELSASICAGDFFQVGTYVLRETGEYMVVLEKANATGCDSTVRVKLTVRQEAAFTTKDTICQGESYRFFGQVYDSSGIYSRRLFGASRSGCDSVLYLDLKVLSPAIWRTDVQICQGASYDFYGRQLTQSGTYRKYIEKGAQNGCDSIVELRLDIRAPSRDTVRAALCKGESYRIADQVYSKAGTYQALLPNATVAGCDSIVVLIVELLKDPVYIAQQTICKGDTFSLAGRPYTTLGLHQDTLFGAATNGCDSLLSLTLNFHPDAAHKISLPLCLQSPRTINGETIEKPGTYSQVFPRSSVLGCDSVLIIDAFLEELDTPQVEVTLCTESAYVFAGQRFDKEGDYLVKVTEPAHTGCDSLVLFSLRRAAPDTSLATRTICEGDSLLFGNKVLREKGVYTQLFSNRAGCDSLVTLTLELQAPVKSNLDTTICLGQKYKNWGRSFVEAGQYAIPLKGSLGCDSLVQLELKLEPVDTLYLRQTLCSGNILSLNGQRFFNTGKYLQVLPAVTQRGCDSLILVDLIVTDRIEESVAVEICPGESYTANGISYFKSGVFTQNFPKGAATGCDSLLRIEVALLPQPEFSLQKALCRGDTLSVNKRQITLPGDYTQILPNEAANGCDSILYLKVQELLPGEGRLSLPLCAGDSIQVAGRTFRQPGIWPLVLDNQSANGCDSLLQLELSGLEPASKILNEQICEGTSYTLDTAVYDTAGRYQYLFPGRAKNGCDSIVNLELELIPAPKKQFFDTLCFGDSRRFYGLTVDKTGMFQVAVPSPAGCDSILSLHLYVRDLPTDTLELTYCPGESIRFQGKSYDKPGLYEQWYPGSASTGCDSLLMLSVREAPLADTTLRVSICNGQTYALNGSAYQKTGNYLQTLPDAARFGCDSLINLELLVIDTSRAKLVFSLCPQEKVTVNGLSYASPGVYAQYFERQAKSGCDSLLLIEVKPLAWGERILFDTLCEGDTTRFVDSLVTTSGVYTRRFPAAAVNGCDSIFTAHYVFKPKQRARLDTVLYENDTLVLNAQRFHEAGVYTQIFPGKASNGCDSVLLIHLTFNGVSCQDSLYLNRELCFGDTSSFSLYELFKFPPQRTPWLFSSPPNANAAFNPQSGVLSGAGFYPGEYTFVLNPARGAPCPRTWLFAKLIVHPAPPVAAGRDTTLTCAVPEATLAGTSCLGCRVEWRSPNTALNQQSLTYKTLKPGTFLFQAQDTLTGCVATDTVLVFEDKEKPRINAGPDVEYSCAERKATLMATATSSQGTLALQWTALKGQFIKDENTRTPTVGTPGIYVFQVTNRENGCVATDTVEVFPDADALTNVQVVNAGPNCDYSVLGSIRVTQVEGGIPPYRYGLDKDSLRSDAVIPNLPPGLYALRIQDVLGCYLDTLISIYPPNRDITVDLGPDLRIFLGDTVTLSAQLNFSRDSLKSISWQAFENPLPCSTCWSPTFAPLQTAKYKATVTNTNDCQASDLVTVYVDERGRVYAPSAFSPNGDGVNDVFRLYADPSVQEVERLQIYNRWGTLMYSAQQFLPNDPGIGWDGTYQNALMDPAVFVFYAEIRLINGERKRIKGEVVLMR